MMTKLTGLLAAAALAFSSLPAVAEIEIHHAYARASGAMANAGAAFMGIMNTGDADDRLIGASTDAAKKAELHTHKDNGDGVMQMMHVPEGFVIPAGGGHHLARGGDHVMMMGLTRAFVQGETIMLTLVFEHAGEITIEVVIDNERAADDMGDHAGHEGHMDHSSHGEGMGHGN